MDSTEQVASEISQRIALLVDMMGDSLKSEMQNLKSILMANPAACLLLKEESIGELVQSLRRITGVAIQEATSKTKTKKAPVDKFSKVDLATVTDDDF